MNNKSLTYLKKKYKFLKNIKEISCGDGWKQIVYDMCKELKDANPPAEFVITHIGERFGELDVHTKNGVMRTRVIVDEYNTQSIDICDGCGNDRDLEQCEKCTVPEVDYSDPEEETEEEEDDDTTCQSGSSCATSSGCF